MPRWLRNLLRIPARTLESLERRRDPVYALQRRADREIPARIPAPRLRMLESIRGNSSHRENRLLAYLAWEAPRGGVIVEIGALYGKSTAWLVEASEYRDEPLDVVSIDPHQEGSWEPFQETVERFRLDRRGLEIRRATSREVGRDWNRPISLLWIDGSHEYADVCGDIELFTPHVMLGGCVVFDDAASARYPGVARAIHERMFNNPEFAFVGMIKNFALFERRRVAPPQTQRPRRPDRVPQPVA